MHTLPEIDSSTMDKATFYAGLAQQVKAITADEQDWIANTANCAAILYHALREINWAGFYFLKGDELVLGPFQGKPACVRIGHGKGVCGAAVVMRETMVVADVHQFPGHIACDSASNSEIVVPMILDGKVIGVLDIDSPVFSRFDQEDAAGLAEIVECLLSASTLML